MARQKGLEPLAYCLEGSCSIRLSYWRMSPRRKQKNGAGDGNRTHVTSLEGWNSTIELHPHGVSTDNILSQSRTIVNRQNAKKSFCTKNKTSFSLLTALFQAAIPEGNMTYLLYYSHCTVIL